MNLVENELLGKFIAAIGTDPNTGFASYYQGDVDVVPQDHCPALMVFAQRETISARDTASDIIEALVTIRAVLNVMQHVSESGNITSFIASISGTIGTFQIGETVKGVSGAEATIIAVGTGTLTLSIWSATPTAGEMITGMTSGATATLGTMAPVGIIQSQYHLRQLMAGRNPSTNEFLPNSIAGVLRNRAQLNGLHYKFNKDLAIEYKTIQQGQFFYVTAECDVKIVSELTRRAG